MTYDASRIKHLLTHSDEMVRRSLVVLYKQQTSDERMEGATIERNYAGFNAWDAQVCTILAQKVVNGMKLNHSEIMNARRMLRKYAKQLAELANTGVEAGV